jgi:hypothetical protein
MHSNLLPARKGYVEKRFLNVDCRHDSAMAQCNCAERRRPKCRSPERAWTTVFHKIVLDLP